MERLELINKGADAVRNTPLLFNAYKQFLLEDWGGLPQGCFGCQFKNHFSQWKNQVLNNNIIPMENRNTSNNKTYVLKDKSTLKYLNGEVWSSNSSDEEWANYLIIKPQAKDLFYVLPSVLEKTEVDQNIEEDFKKKEPSESLMTDVVVGDVKEEETKSRRGRKKQD